MRARSTSDSPLSGRRHHLYYRPKSIFIGGGAPEWGMNNSYENLVLVATVTALWVVTVGFCGPLKSPRLIQETNQSWLPMPFSSAVVRLTTS
jgi:hypothetical protein